MDLSGAWAFELDPDDRGLSEAWYQHVLAQALHLPGSLESQGFGEEISVDTEWTGSIFDRSWFTEPRFAPYRRPGAIKVPFWLQPDRHYQGAAWYQRDVDIPAAWQGRRVVLTLERPHWCTRLWLDEQEIGSRDSLSTPHVYDLGVGVAPGAHRLTIRVDNRLLVNVGPNAHSVSDHTQTNWNGIVGRIELAAGSPVWIADVQVYPDVARKSARVTIAIGNALGQAGRGSLALQARLTHADPDHTPAPLSIDIDLETGGAEAVASYALGDHARLWDEFDPALYTLTVGLDATVAGDHYTDQYTTTFGLREIGRDGSQLAINGRKLFLRGTLECCIFPLTGYPPTDVEAWRRIIQTCRAHGLNHIRFHSWCPPEAAFAAADELGFYYQIECAAWANQGASIGEGAPLDAWLYDEGRRISAAYGNHPSFLLMAYGNEPAGRHEEYLAQWVAYWKERDPRRAHTSGAGWPAIAENQYHNIPAPRIQAWGEGLNSRINGLPPETLADYSDHVQRLGAPIVSHEIGQWCVFPNFDEIAKYSGVLKARNFEIFRDLLAANHMGDQARDFLMASGKLQALCYKEEIESALRTPGFGGFQLLDLHDFPGQGTALVGVLDPFWDSKGYISAAEYRRFCNSTVPLARMARRYWRTGETFRADIDIAHFGPAPLDAPVYWKLLDESGVALAQGRLPPATIQIGNGQRLGTVEIDLSGCTPARKYQLVVGVEGSEFENDWDIWVFADRLDSAAPDDIAIVERLDDAALARLGAGGIVLLMPPADGVRTESVLGFSSVFWNTAWTNGQSPHTLGILCDPGHPALTDFPTEYHSNWQWWELIHGAAAMVLDGLPAVLRPLVQPIDTWFESRRLGLLFEASVAGGKLLVCSIDLRSDLDNRLVARQLRHSLLRYMQGEQFRPGVVVDVEAIRALFTK
jgi:hypothetical protein